MRDDFTVAVARQRTLKQAIHCAGVGVHSGRRVTLSLHPAAPGTGIVFERADLPPGRALIPARWDRVRDTRLCTVLSNPAGAIMGTVEHVVAALAGCGVDNARLELDGPEVPIMDGSAAPFVRLIEAVGTVAQAAERQAIRVLKRVEIVERDASVALSPAPEFSLALEINFDAPAIGRQKIDLTMSPEIFSTELADARTFGFLEQAEALRARGLARGASIENAIVLAGGEVLNPGGLRRRDEFVRHKALDAFGDLALAGAPLLGRFEGQRSGHRMNNALLRALFADEEAWELTPAPPTQAEWPLLAEAS